MKLIDSTFLANLSRYSLSEIETWIRLFSSNEKLKGQIKTSFSIPNSYSSLINESIEISTLELEYILDILEEIANKKTMSLVDFFLKEETFTVQETADYLNVSESYIIKLLERGTIPFHKIENNPTIKMYDLFEYENCLKEKQNKLFEELAKQAQELNLGY